MEDLENKMKDIQFIKVTREIQAVRIFQYSHLTAILKYIATLNFLQHFNLKEYSFINFFYGSNIFCTCCKEKKIFKKSLF